jgi:hypothetical protein
MVASGGISLSASSQKSIALLKMACSNEVG